jgi:hypothetical protein
MGCTGCQLRAAGHRCSGHRPQLAREHDCPPHLLRRHARSSGDGLDHHSLERALAQVAEEQPGQEPLLGLGRAPEEGGKLVPANRLRARAGSSADPA